MSSLIGLVTRLLSIVGIAAIMVAYLLYDFMSRTEISDVRDDLPSIAIVFTGDFDRIDLGLELLSSGRVERLFITGVNGDAGLNVNRFPKQFELSPEQASWIAEGKIVLLPDAHSTIENALETSCWLDQQAGIDRVALITSQPHMARASVALQHAIFPTSVVRVTSTPYNAHDASLLDLSEFSKFSVTWFATLLPRSLWPGNDPTICLNQ
jgi:uncharacterized SAM-binding protein YcdF (DUF218 family)